MPRLVITKGAGIGKEYTLEEECVLGRSPDVTFPIDDNLMSRRHVRIYRDGDGYSLEDLGSRNGTAVNGRRIVKCSLMEGDTISLGGTALVFRQEAAATSAPAAGSPPSGGAGARSVAPPAASAETRSIAVPPVISRPPPKPAAPAAPAASAPAAKPPGAPPPTSKPPAPAPLVTKRRRLH